jgi:hypothetical protein
MQKLNSFGLELQSLKQELLKPDYPPIVKKSLVNMAHSMVEKNQIDVNLHLLLTDEKTSLEDFTALLHETPACLKTKEEILAEFEQIRESLQALLEEMEPGTPVTSNSLIETEQLVFTQTFRLDKQWVSDYFGQPPEEVGKLMVRNGFVEKFAVLRLAKILEDFLTSGDFAPREGVDVKATRVFYDIDHGDYGIHLMFYLDIEEAENSEKAKGHLEYIREVAAKAREYMSDRMMV